MKQGRASNVSQVLQPAFHLGVLGSFVELFAEEAAGFVQRIVPSKDENVYDNLRRTMVGAFMRTTLDEQMGANFEEEVMGMMHFFDVYMLSLNERWYKPLLWPEVIFNMTASGRLIRGMKVCLPGRKRRYFRPEVLLRFGPDMMFTPGNLATSLQECSNLRSRRVSSDLSASRVP